MIRRILAAVVCLVFALTMTFQGVCFENVTKPSDFDLGRTKEVLTGLIKKTMEEKGVPSISIALVKGDEIVWKEAFGYANIRTKTPATPDTIYNAASTFKAVTATAVMQLAEQGKIKLHHPVNRYLGDHPVKDRMQSEVPVNFIHLLSHWSGLTSWPGRAEATMKSVWERQKLRSLEDVVYEMYSIGPPEVKHSYNNYGYAVAGLLVEKVAGIEFEQYVVANILKPLGVNTPFPIRPSPEMVEVMAIPYYLTKDNPPKPAPFVHTDAYPAGGNAFLTAEDMARFLGAQLSGGSFQGKRILSQQSIIEIHKMRFTGNYGLGLRIKNSSDGHTLIRHSGRMPGTCSMMMGDVTSKVGIYYMSNCGEDQFRIAETALALLRGEPYPLQSRKSVQLPAEVLEEFTGVYDMGKDVFRITSEGTSLLIQKNDRPSKSELLAENSNHFFLKNDPSTVRFDKDTNGVFRMVVTKEDWDIEIARKRR